MPGLKALGAPEYIWISRTRHKLMPANKCCADYSSSTLTLHSLLHQFSHGRPRARPLLKNLGSTRQALAQSAGRTWLRTWQYQCSANAVQMLCIRSIATVGVCGRA